MKAGLVLPKRNRKKVYAYHVHSLWDKNNYENRGFLIREMLEDGADLMKLTQRFITRIVRLHNEKRGQIVGTKTLKMTPDKLGMESC